jgi:hypothetical protein
LNSEAKLKKKGSKQKAGLAKRIRDYDMMAGRGDFKAPAGAYHKPGSNKK